MNVFADLHHEALFYSLHLLFEKRLGWNLYYPIGEDWLTKGFWKIAEPYGNHPDTVRQFLSPESIGFDQYKSLNGNNYYEDGVYYCHDPVNNYIRKAITMDKFKETDIDIVISSYQPHDVTFARLITEYSPKAKHIAQMGNAYQITEVSNVMCSSIPYEVPSDKNVVFYHQEFNLSDFYPESPKDSSQITSFVNCLPNPEQFELYKINLPENIFKSYGASCPDGTITGCKKIAEIMRDSLFGYHVKPGGDGFGHIIHNWFACGRPVLVSGNDYVDKLAGNLLIDDVTCIDLDKHTFQGNLDKIRYWSDKENHAEMCVQAIKRFREVVDFNKEEQLVRKFLEKII